MRADTGFAASNFHSWLIFVEPRASLTHENATQSIISSHAVKFLLALAAWYNFPALHWSPPQVRATCRTSAYFDI